MHDPIPNLVEQNQGICIYRQRSVPPAAGNGSTQFRGAGLPATSNPVSPANSRAARSILADSSISPSWANAPPHAGLPLLSSSASEGSTVPLPSTVAFPALREPVLVISGSFASAASVLACSSSSSNLVPRNSPFRIRDRIPRSSGLNQLTTASATIGHASEAIAEIRSAISLARRCAANHQTQR